MGLFGKLKEILFDEETVEIPVITKEEKRIEKEKKNEKDKRNNHYEDEVVIEKIETPPRRKSVILDDDEEDLFDMPKLKEEPMVEVQTKTFTFPVFDDEEITPVEAEKPSKQKREVKEETQRAPKEKRMSGYTNAYDYSYGKYKGDYKSSREENASRVSKVLDQKEEKKAFTPSPIISPVYGVLNENYKKEDIVSKSEKKKSVPQVLDLDSVRRKAYGTLEDEIEVSLLKNDDYVEEAIIDDYDIMEDEGISIDDLLVDREETEEESETTYVNDDTELFKPIESEEEVPNEIDFDDEILEEESLVEIEKGIEEEVEEKKPAKVNVEKTEDKKEDMGEEDLFDLIDSLYEGKGEE